MSILDDLRNRGLIETVSADPATAGHGWRTRDGISKHVANHPRWEQTIELEATAEGPIRVGTVIKRRVNRFGNVTEGTMEVTEFEPESAMRVRTQDGPMTIDGFATSKPLQTSRPNSPSVGIYPASTRPWPNRSEP